MFDSKRVLATLLLVAGSRAFHPTFVSKLAFGTSLRSASVGIPESQGVVGVLVPPPNQPLPETMVASKKSVPSPPVASAPKERPHNEGPLTPVVLLAKKVLGDERLNHIRAKAISLHSDAISTFVVDWSDTPVGVAVLHALFEWADADHNGAVDEAELGAALHAFGFDWLQDKHVHGIFERADVDRSGAIDVDEWTREAPKTLRTNLMKLAKKNGGALGLLA